LSDNPSVQKLYHAGGPVDDLCRACKALRRHTVIVVDGQGQPLRVSCDHCGSQHNFRGGGEPSAGLRPGAPGGAPRLGPHPAAPLPLVSERERSATPVSLDETSDLELLLRRVIREESGLTPVAPATRWRGGQLVLRPKDDSLQEKSWPIETFFHKVVMLRNRLRSLEQQVNASDLPEDQKLKLQSYVTGCYGSLTSFNLLFADEADQFKGAGE
jgi:hypothetical protein